MMSNNHKNPGCGFAEELVSYLYGEIEDASGAAFEAHLAACPACAEELEAFSGVHFSIDDWKQKEFAALETPRIEIPYETRERAAEKIPVSGVRGSWLPALRDFFSFSPRAWSLATASVAILVAAAGLLLFASRFQKADEVVQRQSPTPPANVSKTETPVNSNGSTPGAPNNPATPNSVQKSPQPDVVVTNESNSRSGRPVKASSTQRPASKSENGTKNNATKRNDKNKTVNEPGMIPDEDEDETLRLAEIFEEIDTEE